MKLTQGPKLVEKIETSETPSVGRPELTGDTKQINRKIAMDDTTVEALDTLRGEVSRSAFIRELIWKEWKSNDS